MRELDTSRLALDTVKEDDFVAVTKTEVEIDGGWDIVTSLVEDMVKRRHGSPST